MPYAMADQCSGTKGMATHKEISMGPATMDLDFDTRNWPRGQAFEFDREALRLTYDLRRPAGTDAHWFMSKIRLTGGLMLARNDHAGGHVLVRDRRHVDSNPGSYLKLQIFAMPGGSLASGDRIIELDPGSVFAIDQSRPYRQTMPSGKNLTFFLPHARVSYDPAAMPAVLRFGCQTPEGRFLANAMRMTFTLSGAAVADDNSGLGHAFCGTVAGLLGRHALPTEKSSAHQTSRIEAARRVIDLNLADPEFGPEHVLAKVAASRATLYRDFAPLGGLMAYIKSRRLDMAYHILSMSRPDRGAVSHAAKSAGYSSMASFSREFRDLFGSSPSEILGQWRTDTKDSLQPAGDLPVERPDVLRAIYTWPSATTAYGFISPPATTRCSEVV